MNKKKLVLISTFAIIAMFAIGAANQAVQAIDESDFWWTADAYEENVFFSELDLWVNVTETLSPESQESMMLHGRISYCSLQTLGYHYDINQEFFEANNLHYLAVNDGYFRMNRDIGLTTNSLNRITNDLIFIPQVSTDDPEEALPVGGGDTDISYVETESSLYDEDASTSYLLNFTLNIDDTTEPVSADYLAKDADSEFFGTKYNAGDGLSVVQYCMALAQQNGYTYSAVHNASYVGWCMDESVMNLGALCFEELNPTASVAGLTTKATVLKRWSTGIFKRVRDGWSKAGSVVKNMFNRVPQSGVISGIADVPSNAFSYIKNLIGSFWQDKVVALKTQSGGIFDALKTGLAKIFKVVGGIFGVAILTIVVVVLAKKGFFKKVQKKLTP